jgi:hypothetical protein
LPEKALGRSFSQPIPNYLDPLLLLTFELSQDRILLTRDVKGMSAFFAELGGHIVVIFVVFYLLA